jgi:hypothetical protein
VCLVVQDNVAVTGTLTSYDDYSEGFGSAQDNFVQTDYVYFELVIDSSTAELESTDIVLVNVTDVNGNCIIFST